MSNKRRASAEALKRALAERKRPPTAAPAASDDLGAWQAALAGAAPLPATRRADIQPPRPAPVPRPKTADAAAEIKHTQLNDNPLQLPAAWLRDTPAPTLGDEEKLLQQALQGIIPLAQKRIELPTPKPAPRPIQHEQDERAALSESLYAPTPLELHLEGGDELAYLREGLPRSMLRDLRRGRWVVEDQLDLHGCNRDQARDLLAAFIAENKKRGKRCLRIIHGKGLGSPGKTPVIKKFVAGWLMNYDDVLAYAQARGNDGGAGALLVLLRAQGR